MSRTREDTRQLWRQAFKQVIDLYTESKSINGSMQALDYDKVMNRTPGGGSNSKVVRPSITEFICDVELAATKALKGGDLDLFRGVFVTGELPENGIASDTRVYIEETLGRIFKAKGIFPTAKYFKAKDTR